MRSSTRNGRAISFPTNSKMNIKINSFLAVALAIAPTGAFVPNALQSKNAVLNSEMATSAIVPESPTLMQMVATSIEKDGPPTETEEVYGTVVGDTKGAALRLDNVAISRGASPLLKNIDWSVQPNERWGIVGVNGAGKSTLLGAITGTVRMDEGKAYVHSNVRVGYLRQSVSIIHRG